MIDSDDSAAHYKQKKKKEKKRKQGPERGVGGVGAIEPWIPKVFATKLGA